MWKCTKCGEELEDQFDTCWKCAAADNKELRGLVPKHPRKCLACGSEKLVTGVKTVDRVFSGSEELQVAYAGQATGQAFLQRITNSPVLAVVCGDCGFTSFYSANYKAIYRHYLDEISEDNAYRDH